MDNYLDPRWTTSGLVSDLHVRSLEDLPPEAAVLMDLLPVTSFVMLGTDWSTFLLVCPECAVSKQRHRTTVPCGCFMWVDGDDGWQAI